MGQEVREKEREREGGRDREREGERAWRVPGSRDVRTNLVCDKVDIILSVFSQCQKISKLTKV